MLTLDTHYFPTVDEDFRQNNSADVEETPTKPHHDFFHNESQVIARNLR